MCAEPRLRPKKDEIQARGLIGDTLRRRLRRILVFMTVAACTGTTSPSLVSWGWGERLFSFLGLFGRRKFARVFFGLMLRDPWESPFMTYNHSFWNGERTITKGEFHSLSRVSGAMESMGIEGAPALYSASPAAKNVFIWPEKATG